MHPLRPLAITATVAALSVGLLVMAVSYGWLGPDVGRGANFCEAARADAVVRQPTNTFSNASFVLAGLLVAWHAVRAGASSLMPLGLQTAYASVVVLLGPASAAMHATQSSLGGHLDLLSMYLIAGFAASYAWVRWVRRGPAAFAGAYAACVLGCELVGLWPRPVPVVNHAGNIGFAVLLIAAVVLETRLWRRGETRRSIGFGLAALASMLVAFGIWIMSQHSWCDPHSLWQGHGAWHALCAVATYFLYRLYASERPGVLRDGITP
ncbi:ceramidase domain-containing protein [Nocardioides sp.]|uniref:ceramidase domain-containing protein n=1 Tax=Nocardioides sp. TaxID=35761 RepID=UPI002C99E3A2|nr:ceramidase domain-containing protein [Nocardioides sp.]HXH77486.1 ceramidase domain-containing protein [Nocardioides sp.]